jgi:putative ABC transport system permease protein
MRTRSGPLILLILTLSLAVFSASMAETLDANLTDRVRYRIGADLSLIEITDTAPLLIEQHLLLPGVRAAARVGNYPTYTRLGGRMYEGRFIGVDPAEFAQVAFFRSDFASYPLQTLMNSLAVQPAALLVNRWFLAESGLNLGSKLHLSVTIAGQSKEIPFIVVGVIDYFSGVDPAQGPLFIGSLDYLFEQRGESAPYEIWLATSPEADAKAIVRQLQAWGVRVPLIRDARAQIAAEQALPERQGVLGLLSAGFVAAAVLTVLGFLAYGLVSLERRTIELGILRALGFSLPQVLGLLITEQTGLIVLGGAAGTALGLWISLRFIPLLGTVGAVPPFLAHVAWSRIWPVYCVFGLIFALAALSIGWQIARLELFQAVKLGEVAE